MMLRVSQCSSGLLDEPGNVSVSSGSRTITISWSAPFSLDVTDVDPDIWYSVLIYNVTDETAVSVPYPNCINITETFCVFTPDYPSPCHKYNFTIIPQNGVGNGTADNIVGYTYAGMCIYSFHACSIICVVYSSSRNTGL